MMVAAATMTPMTIRTTADNVRRDAGRQTPPAPDVMPDLALLPLSESFSAAWAALAAECGLALVTLAEPGGFDRARGAVGLIAGAGVEDQIEPVLRKMAPTGIEVAAVGALPDHRLTVSILRAGASEYFALPWDYELLRSWLRERSERFRALLSRSAFAARQEEKYRFDGILGNSPALRRALERAARIIPHANVTVLITGATGTGKELLARAIHYNGPRREAPFVDINCTAIPEQLLESELFGHEKGAFTDATAAKPGLFEVANGGTVLLDEIGHMPLALQGKLLRALEERTMRRLGGTRVIPIDVRVIAATHLDLATAVQRGEFRADLYHRLNVIPLELPPLRERQEDILPLARHFLSRFTREYGLTEPTLSAGARRTLMLRPWLGNVRELRNAVERALLLGSGVELDAGDFAPDSAAGSPRAGGLPFPATIGEIAHAAALVMLTLCSGNKSEAARRLGVSRPRLQRLLERSADFTDDEELTRD